MPIETKEKVKVDLVGYLYDHLYQGENGSIIRYYLKENLLKIFGKTTVYQDEIDLIANSRKVVVNSIFGIKGYFYASDNNGYLEIIGSTNDKEVFKITEQNGILKNEQISEVEEGYQKYIYEVNNNDNSYSLTIGHSNNGGFYKYDFGSIITPIGARLSYNEIFEIEKSGQTCEGKDSFLRRFVNLLKNNNIVKIPINDTDDYNDCIEIIFERLKEENKRLSVPLARKPQ